MATIDKLDIGIYIQYARRTQYIEEINQQFHLEEASSIPPQTVVSNLYPKLSEIDLLLGVSRAYAPWGYFLPPRNFSFRRRSPFTFSRVSPSIVSEDAEEDEQLLASIQTRTPEEKKEKEELAACIKQLHTINEWLGYIVGRIGQLLQG